MRVIYEVNNYRVACTKCKSLLEFGFADVHAGYHNGYIGYIKCPVCDCVVKVLSGKGESYFLEDSVTPEIRCEK